MTKGLRTVSGLLAVAALAIAPQAVAPQPASTGLTACGPGAGSCTEPNGTPGCEFLSCCEEVCSTDPFCCDDLGEWDETCATVASCLTCRCPWDCSAMRTMQVDVPDLLSLLAAWGGPQGSGTTCDFDGNGAIEVPDLLALLANWGPCPE